jgi:SHS2 domain-containing protein
LGGGFRIIEHTADVGIQVWGRNLKEIFEESATAMVSLIVNKKSVEEKEIEVLELEEKSVEELLLRWLKEILFLIESKTVIFKRFQIEKDNFSHKDVKSYFIRSFLYGEKLTSGRHDICREIKAITRHNFYIKKIGLWWETSILFDV